MATNVSEDGLDSTLESVKIKFNVDNIHAGTMSNSTSIIAEGVPVDADESKYEELIKDENDSLNEEKKSEISIIDIDVVSSCNAGANATSFAEDSPCLNNDSICIDAAGYSQLRKNVSFDNGAVTVDDHQATLKITAGSVESTLDSALESQIEVNGVNLDSDNIMPIIEDDSNLKDGLLSSHCETEDIKQDESIQLMIADNDTQVIDVDTLKISASDSIKLQNEMHFKDSFHLPDSAEDWLSAKVNSTRCNDGIHDSNKDVGSICEPGESNYEECLLHCEPLLSSDDVEADYMTKPFSKDVCDPCLTVDVENHISKKASSLSSGLSEQQDDSVRLPVELMMGDSVVEYSSVDDELNYVLPSDSSQKNLVDLVLNTGEAGLDDSCNINCSNSNIRCNLQFKTESLEINSTKDDHSTPTSIIDKAFINVDAKIASSLGNPNLSSSYTNPSGCAPTNNVVSDTATITTPHSGSSSLKESVFRVFRDVAKSVNSDKVNENLSENFKQVYRNVFKNVTSDKFSGQALMNKFSMDGSNNLKMSSSESLNSDKANTKADFFSILNDGEESTKIKVETFNADTRSSSSNFSDVISQSANVIKGVDAFMSFSKTESKNMTPGSSTLSLDTSNSNQSHDMQQSTLPHFMLRTSLTDVRIDTNKLAVTDKGENAVSQTFSRLCQSETNVDQCENIGIPTTNKRVISSIPSSTVFLHTNSEETESLEKESCHHSDLSSSDGEETMFVTESFEQTIKNWGASNREKATQEEADSSIRRNISLTSLDRESDDLSQEISLERCEFIGLEKEQLVDLFLKLRQNWYKTRQHQRRLMVEVERLKSASTHQLCQQQLHALEQQLQQARDSAAHQTLWHQQEQQLQLEQHLNARAALTDQLEAVTKQYQEANTNKEAMVVKYAVAEKNVLVAQKQRDVCERRCRELDKDKDVLLARVKNMAAEKTRLTQILDKKINDHNSLSRECERNKEEVNNRDVKIKWAQNKLKAEMDTHKATQSRLEAAEAAIKRHEAEMAAVRQEAEKTVQTAMQDQNSRANVLDKEVTEQKSRLIVEASCVRQLREELRSAKSAIATLTPQNNALQEQALALKQQVTASVAEREESENLFRSLQQQLQQAQQQCTALQHQLEKQEREQQLLEQSRSELSAAESSLSLLRQQVAQQEAELELLRAKEAELLCFTQMLSETNSSVQSKLNQATEAELSWRGERAKLVEELTGLRQGSADTRQQLTAELTDSRKRLESVCLELQQQTGATQKLLDRVAELEGESALQRKRHANAVKDLTRELQKLRRRVDAEDSCLSTTAARRAAPASSAATVPEAVVVNPSFTAINSQNHCNIISNSNNNWEQASSTNGYGQAPSTISTPPPQGGGVRTQAPTSPRQTTGGRNIVAFDCDRDTERRGSVHSTIVSSVSSAAATASIPSSHGSDGAQDTLSQASRTSSSSSLNTTTSGGGHVETRATNGAPLIPGSLQEVQAQNQVLVQRIVKLQRALAKKVEKEEFLEEHVAQLVGELQKKNKIIDYFVMKEEAGVMANNKADSVKARMMQQRGIMSSIYGSQAKDEALTLELSLEINRKLQALFEDTLLKNITLKESLSTLGDEVARLSMQASRRN